MTAFAWVVFGACAAVCLFVYLGYPGVLLVAGRLRPRPIRRAPIRPSLSVVVPVYNEEAVVGAKLANTLAQDYPADRLEMVVVSDGSTDGTSERVRRVADARLVLIERPREGKVAALTAGVAAARGSILAFTDANTLLAPGALAALVEPFADPEVGGVCGRKRYRTGDRDDTTAAGESAYWSFDTWLKELESGVGSAFAADGALYALRRELYSPPADPAQADDIAISARVVLQGYRLVTEPRAVAIEPAPTEGRAEFTRKVRVTNHSVRALLDLGPRLWTSGFYSFELVGHKLLRHLIPFCLIPLALASLVLAREAGLARLALAGQLALYGLGAAGFLARGTRLGRSRLFAFPYFFCLANAAALVGVLSILGGRRLAAWTPRGGGDGESHGDLDDMRKILIAWLALALTATAPHLLAQEEPEPAPPPEPVAEAAGNWEAGLGAALFDNFFQAPDAEPQEDVRAAVARLGGRTRRGAQQQWELHGTLEHLAYEELDYSDRLGLGGGWEQGRQEASLEAVFDRNRPSFDVGDEFDRADSLRLLASYAYG
ncbi:MAG: glycosyltransferase family 2 protein, partial [Thermoanaerobaculia bacterium]